MADTKSIKNSTSGKRKTNQKKAVKRGSNKNIQAAQPEFIRSEVVIIVTFALCVLLLLSNFQFCGIFGTFLNGIMLGMFGWLGRFAVPIAVFAITCFYLANRGNRRAMLKLLAVVVILWMLCGVSQLFSGLAVYQEQGLFGFYKFSALHGEGGGIAGGVLALLFSSLLGTVGAYLILFVIIVISLVHITEKSVVNLIKHGSGKAYHYAKEDMDRRKLIHDEKLEERRQLQEEQRQLQEEQRIRGVNLDSTKLSVSATEPEVQELMVNSDLNQDLGAMTEALEAVLSDTEAAASASINQADVFRGNIQFPTRFEVEDQIPFDKKDIREVSENTSFGGSGEFIIPEEHKKVVTASGKIIESDTEALKKKLEAKQEQMVKEEESGIKEEIREKEEIVKKEYIFPSLDLLKRGKRTTNSMADKTYKETAIKLQQTLQNFGVGVTVTNISCGPSVTRYELHPEQGVKVSRIVGLADDIKLSLAAEDIRIEAPIPGKSAVGIEVPNKETTMVYLRELFEADGFKKHSSKLAFAVGKDIGGQVIVTDIAKMPHLLIAGATGSGKSVCINTLIMSIIFKADPEDVKLIMVDPKVVELSVYNGIPHLLIPVVTDPKKASGAVNWGVAEMTDRYKKFADYNVRDLKGYNDRIAGIATIEDGKKPKKLPQIVIIVDELADLMMVSPGEVEESICRLAQLARAAGIHLVIATQRPSVNVITGLIKANVPSRIAFSVSSGVDSRTIIDMNGAEKLLGKGDMLFYPSGFPKPQRVQGAFVSDLEVQQVVEFLTQQQGGETKYSIEVEQQISTPSVSAAPEGSNDRDEYFVQAGTFIIEKDKASIGMLQRMFKIGFNRAARVMDQLAEAGVVGEEEGTKPRKVLLSMEEFETMQEQGL